MRLLRFARNDITTNAQMIPPPRELVTLLCKGGQGEWEIPLDPPLEKGDFDSPLVRRIHTSITIKSLALTISPEKTAAAWLTMSTSSHGG